MQSATKDCNGITFTVSCNELSGKAFVDSGCTFNAVSTSYADRCKMEITEYENDLVCTIGGGKTLTVKRCVARVKFDLGDIGRIDSYVFVLDHLPMECDVLFGMDFLRTVNPIIDWKTGRLLGSGLDVTTPVEELPVRHEDLVTGVNSTRVISAEEFMSELASLDDKSPDEFFFMVNPIADTGKIQRYRDQTWEKLRDNPAYQVLRKYKDTVFREQLTARDVPQDGSIQHEIELTDDTPIVTKQFRLSPEQQEAVNVWVKEMLDAGLIRPSTSPYASPIFCVKKPLGWRIVHDYRILNSKTRIPKHPIPRKDDIIDSMEGAYWFSCMDLLSGYYQLLLAEGSRPYTAFTTPSGHYEYLVTAQGLAGAPATFNRFVQNSLQEFKEFCRSFFDDIYVFTQSRSIDDHLVALDRVLQRCEEHQLSIKISKCVFVSPEIPVLGEFVGRNGVRIDPDKVAIIKSWPTPRTRTQLKQFLGTIVYCAKFCPNFGKLVAPLHEATKGKKKNEQIALTDDQLTAFLTLKSAMCTTPVLALPDFSLPFGIRMDACDYAIGGVLFQVNKWGVEHPIAYAGRKMNKAELNYSVREKELLAIIYALKTWRHYLLDQPFVVETDHQTLQALLTQTTCTQRLARWLNLLSEYRPEFKWIPGCTNTTADGISRHPEFMSPNQPASKVDLPQLLRTILSRLDDSNVVDLDADDGVKQHMYFNNYEQGMMVFELLGTDDIFTLCQQHYAADQHFGPIWQFFKGGQEDNNDRYPQYSYHNDLLWVSKNSSEKKLCIPACIELKRKILFSEHDDLLRGHPGIFKTSKFVRSKYYWKNMEKYIKKYVSSCEKCQRNKHRQSKPPGLLNSLPIPEARWQHITMDFLTGLPVNDGYNAIWVIIDRLTKRAHFIPVVMTDKESDAPACAELFRREYQRLHGIPETIISDRDSRFNSEFWQSLMDMQGTNHNMSSAFKPNTDGQSERMNRFITDYLRNYVYACQSNWVQLLSFAELAYNSRYHESIKMSPFEADLGYIPRAIQEHNFDRLVGKKSKREIFELGILQQHTLKYLKQSLEDAQARMKKYYDFNRPVQEFEVGDQVLISSKNLDIQHLGVSSGGSTKLAPLWIGPYPVVAKTSIDTYKLQMPIGLRIHPEFHTSLLKPYLKDFDPNRINLPNEGMIQAGGESGAFLIEDVIGHKKVKGKIHYLVKWLGYPDENNSWESLQSILKPAGGLINNYLDRNKLDKNVWNPPVRRSIRKGKTK